MNGFAKYILQNFERKTTSELRQILADTDSGEWSDDALEIAAAILSARPEDSEIKEPSTLIDSHDQTASDLRHDTTAPNRSKIKQFAEDMKLVLKFIVIPVGCIVLVLIGLMASILWTSPYVTTALQSRLRTTT